MKASLVIYVILALLRSASSLFDITPIIGPISSGIECHAVDPRSHLYVLISICIQLGCLSLLWYLF